MNFNSNSDYVYVYDGDAAVGSPIAIFTGSNSNSINQDNQTILSNIIATAANTSKCLTFEILTSNPCNDSRWILQYGFLFEMSCTEPVQETLSTTDKVVVQPLIWGSTRWCLAASNINDTGDAYVDITGTTSDNTDGYDLPPVGNSYASGNTYTVDCWDLGTPDIDSNPSNGPIAKLLVKKTLLGINLQQVLRTMSNYY
ncbi:MAG: hypothetical protein IPN94_17725 [Sphingobacteriales bacterium]|nr:hypothetical protein [Sphingobacteriales bacterium]